MTSYIGAATSRIDGRAKVTGEAKYAGEFNVPGLAYGYVVVSTIPKGRIARIDTSSALRVQGVIDVLTHENRPRMADSSEAYKDDVAPEKGSPFRPLYDDRIVFSGQPIALVLAEEWEIARFAASLVRIEYEQEAHATDLHAQRDDGLRRREARKAARRRGQRLCARLAVRHEAEYFIPIEHHNPMELYASTVMWDGGGKLTVYDKTQGVQNVQRYLCGVFDMKSDDVRVMSPFVGGAFGSGLRPQYQVVLAVLGAVALERSVRLVLTRQQMYGLGYRPATIERLALGADGGRNARRDHPRGDRGDVAVRGVLAQRHRLVGPAVHVRQRELCAQAGAARPADLVRHACAGRGDRRLRARMRDGRARRRAQDRSAGVAAAVLLGPRPERGCSLHQQEAARMLSPGRSGLRLGRSAIPSRARCATARTWSAGAWRPACGKRCRCRPPPASC